MFPEKKFHPVCEALLMIIHITQVRLLYRQYNWEDIPIVGENGLEIPFIILYSPATDLFNNNLKYLQLELLCEQLHKSKENLKKMIISSNNRHKIEPFVKLPSCISDIQGLICSETQGRCSVQTKNNNICIKSLKNDNDNDIDMRYIQTTKRKNKSIDDDIKYIQTTKRKTKSIDDVVNKIYKKRGAKGG